MFRYIVHGFTVAWPAAALAALASMGSKGRLKSIGGAHPDSQNSKVACAV